MSGIPSLIIFVINTIHPHVYTHLFVSYIYIILTCYLLRHACRHTLSINYTYTHMHTHAVKSFIGLSEYVFSTVPGVRYFMSEKLCQDPLEGFFGKQRMRGGYSDNPTVQSFLYGTVSLRTQKSVALAPKRGNCKRQHATIDFDETPLPKRQRFQREKK